jgi:hypothetical protein
MAEREGFLGRWSRLKREAAREAPAEPAVDLPPEEPLVDLESLPPLESLGAASDYTPFMAKGVPEELRCAALRKAWASDPVIANFRGFAEYDWDCNAPGYGALLPTDNIQQLLSRILRDEPEEQPELVAEEGESEPETERPPAETEEPSVADELSPVAAEGATVWAEGEERA